MSAKATVSSSKQHRPLTRATILKIAHDMIREDGVEALSIRKLAARLSVSPMALYRHVDDKQDLLESVLADILAGDDVCDHAERNWRSWMVETCVRMRRSLMAHPEILPILSATDRMSATELGTFERILSHLEEAGLVDDLVATVFHTSVSFTFGSLTYERFKSRKIGGRSSSSKRQFAKSHPSIAKTSRHLAAPLSDEDFAAALGRILKGF